MVRRRVGRPPVDAARAAVSPGGCASARGGGDAGGPSRRGLASGATARRRRASNMASAQEGRASSTQSSPCRCAAGRRAAAGARRHPTAIGPTATAARRRGGRPRARRPPRRDVPPAATPPGRHGAAQAKSSPGAAHAMGLSVFGAVPAAWAGAAPAPAWLKQLGAGAGASVSARSCGCRPRANRAARGSPIVSRRRAPLAGRRDRRWGARSRARGRRSAGGGLAKLGARRMLLNPGRNGKLPRRPEDAPRAVVGPGAVRGRLEIFRLKRVPELRLKGDTSPSRQNRERRAAETPACSCWVVPRAAPHAPAVGLQPVCRRFANRPNDTERAPAPNSPPPTRASVYHHAAPSSAAQEAIPGCPGAWPHAPHHPAHCTPWPRPSSPSRSARRPSTGRASLLQMCAASRNWETSSRCGSSWPTCASGILTTVLWITSRSGVNSK